MQAPAIKVIEGWTIDVRLVAAIRRAEDRWGSVLVLCEAGVGGHVLTLKEPFDNVRAWWEAWHPTAGSVPRGGSTPKKPITAPMVKRAMLAAKGDPKKAASALGVSPTSLLDFLARAQKPTGRR